jgi:hypothetical protein
MAPDIWRQPMRSHCDVANLRSALVYMCGNAVWSLHKSTTWKRFSPELVYMDILYVSILRKIFHFVALGGLVVACLPLDPRFAGSNLAEDDWFFLRVIEVRSTTSFGGVVKLSVPCRRFTACKRTLRAWKRRFVSKIQRPCSSPVSPASLLDGSDGSSRRIRIE